MQDAGGAVGTCYLLRFSFISLYTFILTLPEYVLLLLIMDITKILKPDPLTSQHNNKPITYDVRFVADGTPKPVILFAHGFKGFKDWGYFNLLADSFAKSGFVFVKFNHSHNGTTPEQPTDFADLEAFGHNNFSIEMDDTGAVIDQVFSHEFVVPDQEINRERFYLMGHSRGGALVLMKAYEDVRVKGVISLAAVTNWEERWPEPFLQQWKKQGVHYIQNSRTKQEMPLYYQIVEDYYANKERFNLPEIIKKLRVPILAFHGTQDQTVPLHMLHDLKEWNGQANIEIVEGGDHTFGGKHPYEDNTLPEHVELIKERSIEFIKDKEAR